MLSAITIVPCFNEARRLKGDVLLELAAEPGRSILFVDDGSTDDTGAMLDGLQAKRPDVVSVLHLAKNGGKAEAVRAGLLEAMRRGATYVGYFDADLATPPEEMLRLFHHLDDPRVEFAMASRVALLGRHIERTPLRHYLGRVFASAASLALAMRVYDTQCGAKALRASPMLAEALATPFTTRWVFDVELMMRLLRGGPAGRLTPAQFIEMPLRAWEDVKGSKLSSKAMLGAAADLARLAAWFRRE
jgi:glycosyltransferase involved in cell wall biosynthesis